MKPKKITWFRKLCHYEAKGVCYYPEYCRFWKTCHRKGTSFLHGWIKKMLALENDQQNQEKTETCSHSVKKSKSTVKPVKGSVNSIAPPN